MVDETEIKIIGNFGKFNGYSLILNISFLSHGGAQRHHCAHYRCLQADSMDIQGPLAGDVSRWFQKAGDILYGWKTIKKRIDVITSIDVMDQAAFKCP